MSRLFSIPLAALVLTPFLFAFYFQVQQTIIRKRMEEKLMGQELTVLKLKQADLVWFKKGKEIILEGRLFDVFSITEKGTELLVSGLFDDAETKLHMKAIRLLDKESRDNSKPLTGYASWLRQLFAAPENISLTPLLETLNKNFAKAKKTPLHEGSRSELFSPPRHV